MSVDLHTRSSEPEPEPECSFSRTQNDSTPFHSLPLHPWSQATNCAFLRMLGQRVMLLKPECSLSPSSLRPVESCPSEYVQVRTKFSLAKFLSNDPGSTHRHHCHINPGRTPSFLQKAIKSSSSCHNVSVNRAFGAVRRVLYCSRRMTCGTRAADKRV